MLVNHFKVSETAVKNMLNGKKGNGGLLAKVKQLNTVETTETLKTDTGSRTVKVKTYQYTGELTGLDMYESISILDYEAVERVTEQFKETLYENKVRVTTGNPWGNLSEVTQRNDNGNNNNIINNVRVTIDIEKESDGKNNPPLWKCQ